MLKTICAAIGHTEDIWTFEDICEICGYTPKISYFRDNCHVRTTLRGGVYTWVNESLYVIVEKGNTNDADALFAEISRHIFSLYGAPTKDDVEKFLRDRQEEYKIHKIKLR